MLTTRQYLRRIRETENGKETLKKLFMLSDLTDTEYWLMFYAFIQKGMVENTCAKLSIQKTKYHTLLNEALIKVEYKIKELDKIRSL